MCFFCSCFLGSPNHQFSSQDSSGRNCRSSVLEFPHPASREVKVPELLQNSLIERWGGQRRRFGGEVWEPFKASTVSVVVS